jgi:hypothetical protein
VEFLLPLATLGAAVSPCDIRWWEEASASWGSKRWLFIVWLGWKCVSVHFETAGGGGWV